MRSEFSNELETTLDEMAESRLLTELVASTNFLSDLNVENLCQSLSQLADQITQYLLKLLIKQYGSSNIGIIALGKWGGYELGLGSDLDFIFVTPDTPNEVDHKIARRFISRLQDQHKGGKIYSIDLRLRPSGSAGPIIVSKEKLKNFLLNTAKPWQRQSYLRSRSCCNFISDKELRLWATNKELKLSDIVEFKRIRQELLKPKQKTSVDLKYNEGGLVDIEFSVQQQALLLQNPNTSPRTQDSIPHQTLKTLYRHFRTLEQLQKLLTSQSATKINLDDESTILLAKILHLNSSEDFIHKTQAQLDQSLQLLKHLKPQ